MNLHKDIDNLPAFNKAVVTMGNFDGVHTGHAAIVKRVTDLAKETGGESVLITFDPHPAFVLDPGHSMKLLHTTEEKAMRLEQLGLDHLVVVPFNRDFSEQTADEYIHKFLVNLLNPAYIVIGFNHRFGSDRSGDIDLMRSAGQQHAFGVEEISKQMMDQVSVSSTEIRKALGSQDIKEANAYLGYPYQLRGMVVRGEGRGKDMGYPTANIAVQDHNKLIPASGVYVVRVQLEGHELGGMLNIGTRPTFDGTTHSVEVHIFDFEEDIYGKDIAVEFVDLIRDEQHFASTEELVKQLQADEVVAREKLVKKR